MFSRPKILFLVSLLFVALLNPKFNPYLLFKFSIFIILVNFTFVVFCYAVLIMVGVHCVASQMVPHLDALLGTYVMYYVYRIIIILISQAIQSCFH